MQASPVVFPPVRPPVTGHGQEVGAGHAGLRRLQEDQPQNGRWFVDCVHVGSI